jgi:hypothetical protein
MVNGRTFQPATVYGANAFKALRDRGYRLGLAWFQASAVAAYIVEQHHSESLNVLENCYYRLKTDAWHDRERGQFWFDFYGNQPSHPRY